MTATQSIGSAKRNPFLNNFLFRLRDNRLLFSVNAVLQIGGALIAVISSLLSVWAERMFSFGVEDALIRFWDNNGAYFIMIGCVMFCIGLLLMMPIAFGSFDHLHKKTRVDMILSLPLTSTQRFWSDYVAGLVMALLPTLVAFLLGAGIGAAGLSMLLCDTEWQDGFVMLLLEGIPLLLGGLSLYTITVFVLCCCGGRNEAPFALFVMLGAPPAMIALLSVMSNYMTGSSGSELLFFLKYCGPAGAITMAVEWLDMCGDAEYIRNFPYFSMFVWALPYLIGTALVALSGWQLYLRRKAENTAKAFVHRWLYHVLMSVLVLTYFLMVAAMDVSSEVVIPLGVFGLVLFLLIEIAVFRQVKRLPFASARYVLTALLAVGMIGLIDTTNLFGLFDYIPAASSVHTAEYNMPRFDGECTIYIKTNDEKTIKMLTDMQKQAEWRTASDLYSYYFNSVNGGSYHGFSVQYTTDFGMRMYRDTIFQTEEEINRLIEFQLQPEIFKQIVGDHSRQNYVNVRSGNKTYTITMNSKDVQELWEMYLTCSEKLDLETVKNARVEYYIDDMPLYYGVHDTVMAYILEYGNLNINDAYGLTANMINGAPILISADSPWYDTVVKYGIGAIMNDLPTGASDAMVLKGITVGYTPEQLCDLTYGVSLFTEKAEVMLYAGGDVFPVSPRSQEAVEALIIAQGKPFTVGMLRDADQWGLFYSNRVERTFGCDPSMTDEEIRLFGIDEAVDTYLALYPDKRNDILWLIEVLQGE